MPVPEANATLFLPGASPAQEGVLGDLLVSGEKGPLLHEGKSGGRLYESPLVPDGIILKEFNSRIINNHDIAETGKLPTLRAHVLLAEGLDRLQQRGPWFIRGVRVLGALMMHATEGATEFGVLHARWALERVHPVENAKSSDYMPHHYPTGIINFTTGQEKVVLKRASLRPALPSPLARQQLYSRAIATAVGPGHTFTAGYDDHPGNTILEKLPRKVNRSETEPGTAVKLDVQGLDGFNF